MMFHVKPSDDIQHESPGALSTEDVRASLAALGIEIEPRQAEAIRDHALAVMRANEQMNLTRVTSPSQVLALHIQDSATALPYIQGAPAGALADIGSGPGYPGMVLAILSGRATVLVESVVKKARFLDETSLMLGLDVEVVPRRAEELAAERPQAFTCVVARAVSSLAALVELASPLLKPGGRLVCMKGRLSTEESLSGDAAALACGMRALECAEFALPGGESRTIVVYERRGTVRERLPRRPGMAQRHPLG